MIGRSGERRSGIFVLAARHDDHDDRKVYLQIDNKQSPGEKRDNRNMRRLST